MRLESSVTSISWIPSETISGVLKAPFAMGAMRYDDPPGDVLEDLDLLQARSKFRCANQLRGSVEIENNRIVSATHRGRGYISSSHIRLGSKASVVFVPSRFPDLQPTPAIGQTEVRFTQTTGGRTGLPNPRRVKSDPYVQWSAPIVWSTLELTIGVDGSSRHKVIGASQFPRHWIYDDAGRLVEKTGLASFEDWEQSAFGRHTPWGDEDSPPLMTIAETALERELSFRIMHGEARPTIRKLSEGETIFEQGQTGRDIVLLLDGIVSVSVDDQPLGDVGPGAILGELALLKGGRRTATVRAETACIIAVADEDQIDRDALAHLAEIHHREDSM